MTRNMTTLTLTKSMINTIKSGGGLVKPSNSSGSLARGSTVTSMQQQQQTKQ